MNKYPPGPWIKEKHNIIRAADGTAVCDDCIEEAQSLVTKAPEMYQLIQELYLYWSIRVNRRPDSLSLLRKTRDLIREIGGKVD